MTAPDTRVTNTKWGKIKATATRTLQIFFSGYLNDIELGERESLYLGPLAAIRKRKMVDSYSR
jgi:hypothetical protein